jgi:hypothetical protein
MMPDVQCIADHISLFFLVPILFDPWVHSDIDFILLIYRHSFSDLLVCDALVYIFLLQLFY